MGSICPCEQPAPDKEPELDGEVLVTPPKESRPDDLPLTALEGTTDSAAEPKYIKKDMLGPACDMFAETLPEWKFELGKDQWKSYSLQESVELDRYWLVHTDANNDGDSSLRLVRLRLMKKDALVDFKAMTCKVGDSRPRKLRRDIQTTDWLSNAYFFEAFKVALSNGGVPVDADPNDIFDFRLNQDFRRMDDDGRELFRGGRKYELPIGWKRFAVNVKGQYDDGNNQWLKEDESGWAVAYHGTSGDGLAGVLCTGFRVGARQKFEQTAGKGIYCTPWIGVAQHYSKPAKIQGHCVQIVLQLRVKPSAIRMITGPQAAEFEKKYWVINDPKDVRAYGVLIRELPLRDWIMPEVMVFGRDHPGIQGMLKNLQAEVEAQEAAANR